MELPETDGTRHRSGRVDFSNKTLLLAAMGLHPIRNELFTLLGAFRAHHVFFGLWNGLHEIVQLAAAPIANLYYMPVATRLKRVRTRRVPARPNTRVFVSLNVREDAPWPSCRLRKAKRRERC